jgi:hypothetical protein
MRSVQSVNGNRAKIHGYAISTKLIHRRDAFEVGIHSTKIITGDFQEAHLFIHVAIRARERGKGILLKSRPILVGVSNSRLVWTT